MHPEIVDFNMTMRNDGHFDIHLQFVREIHQSFIDLTVLHDSGNGKYDMVYTNKTVDICKFLIDKKSNIFFDMVYKMMSDYVEMPKRCPIRKVKYIRNFLESMRIAHSHLVIRPQKQYQLINAFMDPEKFPPYMPDHKARVSILGWYKGANGLKKLITKYNFDLVIQRSFKINGKR